MFEFFNSFFQDNEATVEFFATSAGGDSFNCRER